MGYYIRILGVQDPDIHLNELTEALNKERLSAKLAYHQDDHPERWNMIEVANTDGDTLAQIERNPVTEGELGFEELEEFRDMVGEYKPSSAAEWITDYLNKVKVIYSFQMLNAAFENTNFDIVNSIRTTIWNRTGGILQADGEGFTNEEGYHILWQFSDDTKGDWSCAVLNKEGQWENFIMDLGDSKQREEYMNGRVPEKATRL